MNLFADIKTPIFAPNLPLKEYKRYNGQLLDADQIRSWWGCRRQVLRWMKNCEEYNNVNIKTLWCRNKSCEILDEIVKYYAVSGLIIGGGRDI